MVRGFREQVTFIDDEASALRAAMIAAAERRDVARQANEQLRRSLRRLTPAADRRQVAELKREAVEAGIEYAAAIEAHQAAERAYRAYLRAYVSRHGRLGTPAAHAAQPDDRQRQHNR